MYVDIVDIVDMYVATTSCSVRQLAVIRQLALGRHTATTWLLGVAGVGTRSGDIYYLHSRYLLQSIYTLDIYCRVSTL